MSVARRSPTTAWTTRCSTRPRRAPSPCTTCRPTRARRYPRRCSTALRQRIWDQAENRRHAQKALLELLLAPACRRVGRAQVERITTRSDAPNTEARGRARPSGATSSSSRIESLAFGGEGVARLGDGGYVVFVAGAIPGDRVRAVVHKRKRSYAHARTLEVLDPSPERIAPMADHPGVPWQVLPYERQLRSSAPRSTKRCGGSAGWRASSWRRSCPRVQPWRYRNKLEYSFGAGTSGGEEADLVCGFHAPCGRKPGGCDRGLPAGLRAGQPRPRGRAGLVPRAGTHAWERAVAAAGEGGARGGSAPARRGRAGRRGGERDGPAPRRTGAHACATWSCAKAGAPASCRCAS